MANHTNPRHRRKTLVLALAMVVAGSVSAQTNTAGAVTGRAVSGDTITIINPATGFSRTITVGGDGSYRFSQLPSGEYQVSRNGGSARSVSVNVGTAVSVDFSEGNSATTLDTVTVVGTGAVNPIDVSSVESSTIMTEQVIDRLPVQRDITNVALLAPGTVRGDGRFGNLASFGGASVAENVYYINGFNVTNIVNGLAFSQMPFEALQEQQVKTGGYGAEFGRSLGGVVNMITKRGTNEWKFGANVYWQSGGLSERERIVYDPDRDGNYSIERTQERDRLRYNIFAGGPLIKDRLFVFGLFQGQDEDVNNPVEGGTVLDKFKSPQGLVKLDWSITDNHSLELTAFRDQNVRDRVILQRPAGDQTIGGGTFNGSGTTRRGGDNYVAKWTGYITDNLTLSALYGRGEYSRANADSNSVDCPLVVDARSNARVQPLGILGCWVGATVNDPNAGDVRRAWRFDGEWSLGSHLIRFGVDREQFATIDGTVYTGTAYDPTTPGGIYWRYVNTTPGATLPTGGGVVPAGVTEVVRKRYFENGGNFLTKNSAWYLEDSWNLSDTFLVYLGIRNESFTNLNSLGQSFIDVKNTWAPRLGFSWDVRGDSSMKVFANAGRYYVPVYANTNVRLAGSELDYQEWYTFTAIDPDTGEPTLGTQIGAREYTSDGGVPDPRTVVDNNLSPMFQDEYILGMQMQLSKLWTLGVRGIHRDLKSGMDDVCDGSGARTWALANGYSAAQAGRINAAIDHCFLTNPGKDLSANVDINNDGNLVRVDIPADAMGIPQAKRKYSALEIFAERAWDDRWFLQASYTFAKSIGNTEGYVKSDNGQGDAGITQDFDYKGLTDGAYGYLPNHRNHSLKVFGSYKLNDEWSLGANLAIQSGRPVNCFGIYPVGGPSPTSRAYGVASFYCGAPPTSTAATYTNYLHPRGTSGRTPWTRVVDARITYEPTWMKGLTLGLAINNLFDTQNITRVLENYEDAGGAPSPAYLQPAAFSPARSLEFMLQYEF